MKHLISILIILILLPLVIAPGEITNVIINQPLPNSFIAGNEVSTVFSFEYPDKNDSLGLPFQRTDAPLVIVVEINSNDSDYPVWKGDFEVSGGMVVDGWFIDREYEFDCVEDVFSIDYFGSSVLIDDIPNGTFYCTEDDFLAMLLDSKNEIRLNVSSNPALYPGVYNFNVGLYYPENLTALPEYFIYSPLNGTYGSRRVRFNLTLDAIADYLGYINLDNKRPSWRTLCRDCNEYGYSNKKLKSLNEGENELILRAIDNYGQRKEERISLFIDSKKPRVHKTFPRRNKYTNGNDFYVKYSEDNFVNLSILIWFNGSFERFETGCQESGKYQECYFNLDLSKYQGEEIEYQIEIWDIVRRITSRKTRVKVDVIEPVVNNFEYIVEGRKVNFKFNISEENFDEVRYSYVDNRGRFKDRKLCSRLKNGICEKKKSFKSGVYNFTFSVLDDAGNRVEFVEEIEV